VLVARPLDEDRRAELLDAVVAYLAERGLAELSLRPMAKALGVSLSGLVHHFGSKERLVVEALERSIELQTDVRARWLRREPGMTQADQLRAWWKWINASKANLALVRLGIEAAALDATISGLPGAVRADQIGLWRSDIEAQLVVEGLPRREAVVEASVTKALFTGLVIDLLASGDRRRLGRALEVGLTRLERVVELAPGRHLAAGASSSARTG
jgi:AcrR family transcriptional regulator